MILPKSPQFQRAREQANLHQIRPQIMPKLCLI